MPYKEVEHEDGSVTVEEYTPRDPEELSSNMNCRWKIRAVHGPYTISTVFLGTLCEPYETMMFVGDSSSDTDFDRYPTRAAAIEGHHRISEKWKDVLAANVALLGESFWTEAKL